MDSIRASLKSLTEIKPRQVFHQLANLGLIATAALIIWKSLMLATGSESPIVVVLSGSMEPGFQKGDILFLNLGRQPVRTGEIVVYKVSHRVIPIVHRVITIHEEHGRDTTPNIKILTKGDNNIGHDRSLYAPGQSWLNKEHIMGRVVGFFPYLGMFTIIMNKYPYAKVLLLGLLAVLVLTTK